MKHVLELSLSRGPAIRVKTTQRLARRWLIRRTYDINTSTLVADTIFGRLRVILETKSEFQCEGLSIDLINLGKYF